MEQNNTKQTTTVGSFLNWATNNLSLFSFSIAALGIVVAFLFFAFQCGQALRLNIPLDEVPFSNSIEAIILYLTVGLVLVAPNYYCYKQFSVLPNCGTKLLFLLRKPFLFCLLISFSFYVVAFFCDEL